LAVFIVMFCRWQQDWEAK